MAPSALALSDFCWEAGGQGSLGSVGGGQACEHVSPSLQEKAEEVYRLYQNSPLSSHPVVALSELSTLCVGPCPDERTFYLVLLQLQKEKRVTVLEQNGEKVWSSAVHSLTPR